jgi:hypothetical protein
MANSENARPPKTRTRNASRRWCIPPAITGEATETLEYVLVLEEHPARYGVLFWQALRDVTLWASAEPERRAGLFKPGSAEVRRTAITEAERIEARIAQNLTTLTAILATPDKIDVELVEVVCLDLSAWAEDRAALATAVSFAQAAALARPEMPHPATRVGHLAIRWGRYARAETWLRRGTGLARRAKDWECYGQACVALADIYVGREQPETAKRLYVVTMRVGRRHSLPTLRATALHGLMRLALAAAEFKEARRYAHAALRAYGRGHPRLSELMQDIAHLMVLTGENERAVSYLRKLVVGVSDSARRARLLAMLARAAAGVAADPDARTPAHMAKETYRAGWSDAWILITGPGRERAASDDATLLDLAHAAAAVRDLPRLEQAARLQRDATPTRRSAVPDAVALQELVKEFRTVAPQG